MVTVYVDVLVGLNWFVNFFLLLAVSKIGKTPFLFWRALLSSFLLGIGSLTIFLPPFSVVYELLIRLSFAFAGVLIAFGYYTLRLYITRVAIFFSATFGFGGIMLGLWSLFHPRNMVLNNGVYYFNLSPIVLVGFTLLAYGILWVLRKHFGKEPIAEEWVTVHIKGQNKTVTVQAKVDTGFTLEDVYTSYPLLLVSPIVMNKLFPKTPPGFRLLPFRSVGGEGLLQVTTLNNVTVCCNKTATVLPAVSVATGNGAVSSEWEALVGCDFLERMNQANEKNSCSLATPSGSVCQKKNRLYQRLGNLATTPHKRRRNRTDGAIEKR